VGKTVTLRTDAQREDEEREENTAPAAGRAAFDPNDLEF
jgi:hypothetical protein